MIWNPPLRQQGDLIIGRAMDNRGALAILETLLATLDHTRLTRELWVASTVLEEAGTIAAASLQQLVGAEYSIAVDVAPAVASPPSIR